MVDSREWVETRKRLRAVKLYTLASLPEGKFGRIVGRCVALPGHELAAPFTERRCLAYSLGVEGVERRFVERAGVMFAIEAEGQRAIVDAVGAQFALSRHHVARTQAFDRPTQKQRELLDQIVGVGIAPDGVTYEEAIIAEGDELVIAGFAMREPDRAESSADPYRGVPTRLRLVGGDTQPLLITNDRKLV